MEPQTTVDIVNSIGTGIATSMISMVAAMLTPAIGFLAVASLMLTQGVKVTLTYLHRSPPAEMIWFVIGPIVTLLPAYFIWTQPGIHWVYAACAASLMANLVYALLLKRLVGRLAPSALERINAPKERRRRDRGPPKGEDRRR